MTVIPQPPPQYPTAPPWASPAPVAGPAPFTAHGQLLVPYPEEMHHAARPTPPAWWPVVALTFFVGVFGLIATTRRAAMARRGRNSVAPYWIAWGLTLLAGSATWVVAGAVGVPAYLAVRQAAVTRTVQENIVSDGRVAAAAGVTVSAARCSVAGAVAGREDLIRYDCVLTLGGGRTGELSVTADGDGRWSAVTG